MWLILKIYDKEKDIKHEPIRFDTDRFKVVLTNEDDEELLNTEKINEEGLLCQKEKK